MLKNRTGKKPNKKIMPKILREESSDSEEDSSSSSESEDSSDSSSEEEEDSESEESDLSMTSVEEEASSSDSEEAPPPPSPARKKRKTNPPKKRKKNPRVDFTLPEPHVGELVRMDEHGEWRTVPGFSRDKLIASSFGFVQVAGVRGVWQQPHKGTLHPNGRYMVYVDGYHYLVNRVVCRAFVGPAPSPYHEADHENRDPTDNKATNLRWVTKSKNIQNQREVKKDQRTGKPILVRKLNSENDDDWEWFPSTLAASKAYGLKAGNLSGVAHDELKQTGGYEAKWAPPNETQEDLEVGDDSNLLEPPPTEHPKLVECPEAGPSTEKEVWKMAPGVKNLRVSTRARVQTKLPRGDGWSHKYTPQPTDGHVYASVTYKGKKTKMHNLVYMTFVGPIPDDYTIDHKIPERKFDNRLCHLRLATRREQILNQNRKPTSEQNNSRKKPVEGKPKDADDDTTYEWFESANEAARQLNARFPSGTKFRSGGISDCCNKKKINKTTAGWVFRYSSVSYGGEE